MTADLVRKSIQDRINKWKVEETKQQLSQAHLALQVAQFKSDGEIVSALCSKILYLINERLNKVVVPSDSDKFPSQMAIGFKELDTTREECESVLSSIKTQTGFKLSLDWSCDCCWADAGHDGTCGVKLVVGW